MKNSMKQLLIMAAATISFAQVTQAQSIAFINNTDEDGVQIGFVTEQRQIPFYVEKKLAAKPNDEPKKNSWFGSKAPTPHITSITDETKIGAEQYQLKKNKDRIVSIFARFKNGNTISINPNDVTCGPVGTKVNWNLELRKENGNIVFDTLKGWNPDDGCINPNRK